MRNLYELLREYSGQDYYPFHMPGHKRRISHFRDAFGIDITEIEGFDNLHHAEGVLLEAQRRAAKLYGAEETCYLINGSTAGILAAVSACSRRGGRILMARNCHKSAYHALFLNGLHAVWIYPDVDMTRGIYGSVGPERVRELLEQNPGISAVLLTSPTYDGVVSDIRGIAQAAHEHGAVLIVDEAHGAHFAMSPYFPASAVACGADIVINSIHKTMPSLTQTALLHVCGPRADRVRLKKYLEIYQSSSPSYVLMAGIDCCVHMMTEHREELFAPFCRRIDAARERLSEMKNLHLVTGEEKELSCYDYDRSRILVSTENSAAGGRELYRLLLDRYHIQAEMAAEHYVTFLTSVADTQEGFDRLCGALLEIDAQLTEAGGKKNDGLSGTERKESGEGTEAGESGGLSETERKESGEGIEAGESGGLSETGRKESGEGTEAGGKKNDGLTKTERKESGKGASAEGNGGLSGTGRKESGEGTAAGGETRTPQWDIRNEEVLSLEEADNSEKRRIPLEKSAGCVSGEYISLYPPGIPLLIPGERITQQLLDRLAGLRGQGFELQGLDDHSGETIIVIY